MRSTLGLVVFTSALALVSACKDKPAATPPVTAPAGPAVDPGISMDAAGATAVTPTPAPTPPVAGALTDPQIAAIVVAANQVDIDAGNLALKKAKSAAVKAFAQTMITDHSAVTRRSPPKRATRARRSSLVGSQTATRSPSWKALRSTRRTSTTRSPITRT